VQCGEHANRFPKAGLFSKRGCNQACFAFPLLLMGCAGPLRGMREVSADQLNIKTDPSKATVIIMRPSRVALGMSTSLFELRPDGDRFVGFVPARRMLAFRTDPGVTRFMMVAEREDFLDAVDFLDATLGAGKTYYAAILPRPRFLKTRLRLLPENAAQLTPDLLGCLIDCSWVENTSESRNWANGAANEIERRKVATITQWEAINDRAALRESDGLSTDDTRVSALVRTEANGAGVGGKVNSPPPPHAPPGTRAPRSMTSGRALIAMGAVAMGLGFGVALSGWTMQDAPDDASRTLGNAFIISGIVIGTIGVVLCVIGVISKVRYGKAVESWGHSSNRWLDREPEARPFWPSQTPSAPARNPTTVSESPHAAPAPSAQKTVRTRRGLAGGRLVRQTAPS
jgi:hypothetical protein